MFIIRLMSRVPLGILYVFSDVLAFLLHRVIRYRRKVILKNLQGSFPDLDEQSRKDILAEFYYRFTDYAVETLKVPDMDSKDFSGYNSLEIDPLLQEMIDQGQPVIFLLSHQFNWEWILHNIQYTLPAGLEVVYQRLSNQKFDKYMSDSRTTTGIVIIEKSQILRHVAKSRDSKKAIVLLADQSPRSKGQKYWTTFMNQETAFVIGPEAIANMTKRPVFFLDVRRKSRRHYHTQILPVALPPYNRDSNDILEKYVQMTEAMIRQDPPGYLWSHKRWKLKRPDQTEIGSA